MRKVALYRVLAVAIPVALLELACRAGWISRQTMPPPSEMVTGLVAILQSGRMTGEILETFKDILIAFAGAVLAGVVGGAQIHRAPPVRRVLEPLFSTYYAVPIWGFYPLFLVIFGLGDLAEVLIGFMLAVVAVIAATLGGLDSVPAVLVKTARVFRLGPARTAWSVSLPYAAPQVFTGVKLAVAYSAIGVIGAEFIMGQDGLGYEIRFAYDNLDNAVMYPLILLVLLVSVAVNMTLDAWDRALRVRRGAGR
ncbi:MAG: ABC transporter permease [Caulobacteraceae bacterium]